ncbi:phage antirepressor N-terminal domain-containing protein [Mannheimia haemolytica]
MKALKAKFFGSDILVINQNDKPYVPMKQVAENIGLVWHAQFERLQRNEVLSQGIRVIRIPSNGGEQEAVCLPLHYLNGWLFGVNPSRVNPEIKEKADSLSNRVLRSPMGLLDNRHCQMGGHPPTT